VLIEARRSMQCVVRGFLETSAHKPHRYISRYHEIFEKKVAAYRLANTVSNVLPSTKRRFQVSPFDVAFQALKSTASNVDDVVLLLWLHQPLRVADE